MTSNHQRRRGFLFCGILLTVAAVQGLAGNNLKHIDQLLPGSGLVGGGTGPSVTVGIAAGGVTSGHVKDGTLQTADFAAGTLDALRGAPGPQGPQGPSGPQGPMGLRGQAGHDALVAGPGPGGSLSEIATDGTPAPGGGTFSGPWVLAVNSRGQSLFSASAGNPTQDLDRDGVPDDLALFFFNGRQIDRLIRIGDAMPDGSIVRSVSQYDSQSVTLTDLGQIYVTVVVDGYIPNRPGRMRALYGWDGTRWFTIVGKGTKISDGRLLAHTFNLRLQSPHGLLFKADVYDPVGVWLGTSSLAYEAP
jgi:hypothetical protein